MADRYYSSNARETSLTANINSSVTTILVDNPIGYPAQTPFEIHCELGTSNEEIMLVTAVAGSSWTVTRGYDGSSALAHDTGAKIVHGVSAIDFTQAQTHFFDTTGVHGLAPGSALVGTTDSQTLTNKTFTAPTINGGTFSGDLTGTPGISNFTDAQHSHQNAIGGGALATAAITGLVSELSTIDSRLDALEADVDNLPYGFFKDPSGVSGTSVTITWNTPILSTGDVWSSGNPSRWTAPINGIYAIGFSGRGTATTSQVGLSLGLVTSSNSYGNLDASASFRENFVSSTSSSPSSTVTAVWPMSATSTVLCSFNSVLNASSFTPTTGWFVCLKAL